MLKLRRPARHARRAGPATATASLLVRPDLQIRNLLDDPCLRRAMGLDEPAPTADTQPMRAQSVRERTECGRSVEVLALT